MTWRANAVGWLLVGFFLIGGIIAWAAVPEIYMGQIWVVVALGLAAAYLYVPARDRRRRAKGIPGRAVVLGVTQTGVYVNHQPRVRLRLRVEAEGVQPYEAEKSAAVPMVSLGELSSGRALRVYIDRDNHKRFMIDWGASETAPAASGQDGSTSIPPTDPAAAQRPWTAPRERDSGPAERLTKLIELKNAGLISEQELAEQRRRILESL